MPDRELEWDFWDKCFWKLNALKLSSLALSKKRSNGNRYSVIALMIKFMA